MLRVGITGGIGSGKSTACAFFESLGVPVYYADARARSLMENVPTLKQKIINKFGAEAYLEDGTLNRKYIASKVFSNRELLEWLNRAVHPVVAEDSHNWNFQMQKAGHRYAIHEAALLIESGIFKKMDKIIVVYAPFEDRLARVVKRDGVEESEVIARMKFQMEDEEKKLYAHYILHNKKLNDLKKQVHILHHILLKEAEFLEYEKS
ncbi:MAG: dephospho-CoA kinase [Chitinophagales bacterium]|nr:dephospho-CoA kinase [Chitinophagales bacterium]MDW8273887.1 dephospho-CoA kinase [Chitinophagales bacterium]